MSYPTVRRMLDQTIQGLGYQMIDEQVNKQEVLARLEKGELSVEEATELLKR